MSYLTINPSTSSFVLLWKFEEQSPLLGLRCLKAIMKIKAFSLFSPYMNHDRTDANIFCAPITAQYCVVQ